MNILITGSRKGIGHFMATQYLERGHTVIGCSRSEAEIDHPQYCHFEVDVTDEKAIRAMLREITRTFGSLDTLINNAGVASMNHLLTTTRDTAQNIIDTNLMGTFLMTRDCGKLMSRAGKGRIINLTTVAAGLRLEGKPFMPPARPQLPISRRQRHANGTVQHHRQRNRAHPY